MATSSTACPSRCRSPLAVLLVLCALAGAGFRAAAQTGVLATTVPLLQPSGVAYDAAGNLYVAEARAQLVVRVTPAGLLSPVAGNGVQGFAGDGGAAISAMLDTPTAVAVDSAGDLLIADTHNHRVRRVDAVTGAISTIASGDSPCALAVGGDGTVYFADRRTQIVSRVDAVTGAVSAVAGSGMEGFSGDGGPALAAALDQPAGLAVDGLNHLFLADSHNGRVRVVNLQTGLISTLPGAVSLRLPRGIISDSSGNLLIAERSGNRVLQGSASAAVTAVAGTGTQGFAGDGSPAVAALLDSPGAVTLSPAGLPVIADTGNGRVRAVDSFGVIHTYAGLGLTSAATLTLSAPSVMPYGNGSVVATLNASAASGQVNFFNAGSASGAVVALGSEPLAANVAALPTNGLPAGSYRISASYGGDGVHPAAESQTLALTVALASAVATPAAVSLVYGQGVPALTGTLAGVLAQDAGKVSLVLSTAAAALSAPGSYPVSASLSGSGAANYTLATVPAAVTIAQAPSMATLTVSGTATLAVRVASSTVGVPSGRVTLLEGSTSLGAAQLDGTGNAVFSSAGLSTGTHTLLASYAGEADFLACNSAPVSVTIAPVSGPDFALAATGQTSVTVPAGSAAQFGFAVTPVNGALSSPIVLSAAGLPTGATASFNPGYLPPSGTASAFILTISTPKAALARPAPPWAFALLLPLLLLRRRRVAALLALLLGVALLAGGCGDRINTAGETSATSKSYTIAVSATATSSTGTTILHTAAVTLNVQ